MMYLIPWEADMSAFPSDPEGRNETSYVHGRRCQKTSWQWRV